MKVTINDPTAIIAAPIFLIIKIFTKDIGVTIKCSKIPLNLSHLTDILAPTIILFHIPIILAPIIATSVFEVPFTA